MELVARANAVRKVCGRAPACVKTRGLMLPVIKSICQSSAAYHNAVTKEPRTLSDLYANMNGYECTQTFT